jgi:MSHA biogenesis protein MshM
LDLSSEPTRAPDIEPFGLSPDARFFFNQSSHGETLDGLLEGINGREGILVVTGAVGSGKSTLCSAILHALNQTTFSAFIPDACASRDELLKTLLVEFGIISADSLRSGPLRDASRTQLRYTLDSFLRSLEPLRAFAVVVIDEAHKLSIELLHEIHLMSVLQRRHKLLVFVLVGQPGLKWRLGMPEMRQLAQRVSIWSELRPLARKDLRPYVSHRLAIAGDATRHFTEAAIDMVYAASGGVPRVINMLCDRALSRANYADTIVDAEDLLGAIQDLQLPVVATLNQLSRDRPEGPQETLDSVTIEVPPQRGHHEPPAERQGSLGAANPTAGRPAGAAQAAPRSSFTILRTHVRGTPGPQLMTSDEEWLETSAAFVRQPQQSPPAAADSSRAAKHSPAPPEPSDGKESVAAGRPRRIEARPLVIASVMLTTAAVGFGFWVSRPSPQRPDLEAARAQPSASDKPPLPASPNEAVSTMGEKQLAVAPNPVPGQSGQAFAVQMGTFQNPENAARTVEEFQNAGYRAYSARVALPSGRTAIGVFLGPYAERAEAERDLQIAARNPEYAGGHVVRVGRALKPPS